MLLVSRMRDESPHSMRYGIIRTLSSTGGVITAAGLIFAASMWGLRVFQHRHGSPGWFRDRDRNLARHLPGSHHNGARLGYAGRTGELVAVATGIAAVAHTLGGRACGIGTPVSRVTEARAVCDTTKRSRAGEEVAMQKLLAGVTALVTLSATGCFGIGIATADDGSGDGTPADPMAYALGGAHVPGIPYDEYGRRLGAGWFPGLKREIVDYPAGQVQGHVLERLFPGIGRLDEAFPGLGVDGPSVGESVASERTTWTRRSAQVAPVPRLACPRVRSCSTPSRPGSQMIRPLPHQINWSSAHLAIQLAATASVRAS